jgi:hypothetical protein
VCAGNFSASILTVAFSPLLSVLEVEVNEGYAGTIIVMLFCTLPMSEMATQHITF